MYEIFKALRNTLVEHKAKGYIVGGFVRDKLMGRPSSDLDIVVDRNVFKIAETAASVLGGTYFVLDSVNQVARVVVKNTDLLIQLDFSAMQGSVIEEDLSRRDFTINSMALQIDEKMDKVIDPLKGQKDIKNKIIRMTSRRCFSEDPLRILRAFRFAARLNFIIEKNTLNTMAVNVKALKRVSGERILDEMAKLLEAPGSCQYVKLADEKVNLWSVLLPQVNEMKETGQSYPHRDNVWEHSLRTLYHLEKIMAEKKLPPEVYQAVRKKLDQKLAGNRSHWLVLKLACLLHDVGKTVTFKKQAGGRITFYRHEKEGIKFIKTFSERVRLSSAERQALILLVENHMRPLWLFNEPQVTNAAVYRLGKKLGSYIYHCLLLSLADVSSTYVPGGNISELVSYQRHIFNIFDKIINEPEKTVRPPRIVSGDDLIKFLGIPGSKIIGEMLDKIAEAQVNGRIKTRAEALEFASKLLK